METLISSQTIPGPTVPSPAAPIPASAINHERLACQIVRALRGEHSQRDLSLALGYSFNQVGKWESGATQITWDDFVTLAVHAGHSIEKQFRRLFWSFVDEFNAKAIINYFLTDHRFIQDAFPASARTVRRLRAGESQVRLADVHRLVAVQPPLLLGWLESFLDPAQLPEIQAEYAWHLKRLDLVGENPLAVYVKAAIELDVYKKLDAHDDRFVARHATCSVEEARSTLRSLLELRCIDFDGAKYRALGDCFSFGSLASGRLKSLTRYSTSLTAQRYLTVPSGAPAQDWVNPSVSSVRVRPMSKQASQKVLELVERFHRDVAEVVATDDGEKENVQVLLVHFFASVANAPTNDLAAGGAPNPPGDQSVANR